MTTLGRLPLIRDNEASFVPNASGLDEYHLLIQLPRTPARTLLLGAVSSQARLTVCESGTPLPRAELLDIAVLHADGLCLACGPLLYDISFGLPEIVLVVDDPSSAQYLALKSRGFRNVVRQEDLCRWLPAAIQRLGLLARARRIVMDECTADAVAPSPPPLTTGGVKLHAAEMRFRDVFLRSLLAEHGSRRKAAEAAGVPYRSFCEMLRKLGI